MQGLVTSAVTSIDQANNTAEGNAKRSMRDFQFGVGDAVLLSTKYLIPEAFIERKRKLAAKFAGSYELIEVISPVAYRLQLPVGTKAHNLFHASMLKPYHGDANTERATLPPLPVVMQDLAPWTLFATLRGTRDGSCLYYRSDRSPCTPTTTVS
jgi:hypothetical protein